DIDRADADPPRTRIPPDVRDRLAAVDQQMQTVGAAGAERPAGPQGPRRKRLVGYLATRPFGIAGEALDPCHGGDGEDTGRHRCGDQVAEMAINETGVDLGRGKGGMANDALEE